MSSEPLPTPPECATESAPGRELRILRRLLLVILVLGLLGTTIDLLLLNHFEDVWQLIPLLLLGAAVVVVGWHLAVRNRTSVHAVRVAMSLLILGSLAGGVLHFRASAEFHTEMEPVPRGWELAWAVLRSKVPPALAPAVLLQMGLVGLAYTYRHPALRRGVAGGPQGDPT